MSQSLLHEMEVMALIRLHQDAAVIDGNSAEKRLFHRRRKSHWSRYHDLYFGGGGAPASNEEVPKHCHAYTHDKDGKIIPFQPGRTLAPSTEPLSPEPENG